MAEQIINSDGKTYRFNPGPSGSLTVTNPTPRRDMPVFLKPNPAPKAKVIPDLKKAPIIVASSRG